MQANRQLDGFIKKKSKNRQKSSLKNKKARGKVRTKGESRFEGEIRINKCSDARLFSFHMLELSAHYDL